MPRVVSFVVLTAILLLIGALFYRVMLNFFVPLFLAGVLVVVFEPLHEWVQRKLPGKPRTAALATTAGILLTVLLPTIWLTAQAYVEGRRVVVDLLQDDDRRQELIDAVENRAEGLLELYAETVGQPLELSELARQSLQHVGKFLLGSFQAVFAIAVGLAIMILAVYFFLVDGPKMIETIMQLSPLDDEYEREFLDKFAAVSRAVVVASLLSAVVQGLLAGIGYFFALPGSAPVIMLTMLTMVLAIVPFVGAAAVWVPVALYIFFMMEHEVNGAEVQGHPLAAVILAVYSMAIVSSADNFIKPMVLHGQSNLHPLLALLSVLGGVQVLGPIGILVGPMLVAFLQAILNMINRELKRMETVPA